MVQTLDKERFKTHIYNIEESREWKFLGNKPAIINFYANWWESCKMLTPVMEELSNDYMNKIDFYKLNIDVEREIAGMFRVHSIPSILFIPKNGHPRMAFGRAPKPEIEKAIKDIFDIDCDKPKIEIVGK